MREIQHGSNVVVNGDGVSHGDNFGTSQLPEGTLSAMQAATLSTTSTFNSVVLEHFGDGPVFQAKGKEKEDSSHLGPDSRGEVRSWSASETVGTNAEGSRAHEIIV